jgi:hypothetical protein
MAKKTIDGTSVQLLVRRQYADKVTGPDGKERDSKMKDKFYWLCTCEEGRFTVEENSAIHKALENGDVFNMTVDITDDGVEYVTHKTHDAVMNQAKAKGTVKYYENFYVPDGAVAKEDLIG